MNIDRVVLTTFAGYYFTQILCLRSIQQYAAGFPIDIIIDDFDIKHWSTYPDDCQQYVKRNFPDVPEDLKVACPDLREIDPNTTKLSEVVSVVSSNYGQYHECRIKTDAWIEWYNSQKQIFDSVK